MSFFIQRVYKQKSRLAVAESFGRVKIDVNSQLIPFKTELGEEH